MIARRPDQRDAAGREEGIERMRHANVSSFYCSVPSFVMAGLVPAIHVFLDSGTQDVDARDKPGHDGKMAAGKTHATRRNVTPPISNVSPDILYPLAFATSRTFAASATRNVSPLMISLSPLIKRKLQFGSFTSASPA